MKPLLTHVQVWEELNLSSSYYNTSFIFLSTSTQKTTLKTLFESFLWATVLRVRGLPHTSHHFCTIYHLAVSLSKRHKLSPTLEQLRM